MDWVMDVALERIAARPMAGKTYLENIYVRGGGVGGGGLGTYTLLPWPGMYILLL